MRLGCVGVVVGAITTVQTAVAHWEDPAERLWRPAPPPGYAQQPADLEAERGMTPGRPDRCQHGRGRGLGQL